MQISAEHLAHLLGGTVEGDPTVLVNRPSKIEEGGQGSISFLGNMKYESYAYTTTASLLLVASDFQPKEKIAATLIRVPDVYAAIALLLEKFSTSNDLPTGIASNAFVHETAAIGPNGFIGMFSVILEQSTIGKNCQIHPHVYIGKEVHIGDGVKLFPGVKIMDGCVLGNKVTIHPNTVIGSDGFGFAPQEDGSYQKIAHVGNVIIEDQVEIGANTSIDRASMGSTIIRKGAKLDNLIQVAHNVEIGAHTVIASQAGIAGSTKIGAHCRIGGQVGFVGHINVAEGTQIQAQSGIASEVRTPNTALFGSPAIPYRDYIKSYAVFRKLPALYKKIFDLEKQLKQVLKQKPH